MILYTPIIGTKIVPNDWNAWWDIWNKYCDIVEKTKNNHNNQYTNPWKGVDLLNIAPPDITVYSAPIVPLKPVVVDLIKQVINVFPIKPYVIRVIENTQFIKMHSDNQEPSHQFRSILWSNYEKPLWKLEYKDECRTAKIPNDTNSFYFRDFPLMHEAIYEENCSKGLIVVYGSPNEYTDIRIKESAEYYSNYAWVVDEN